MKRISYNVFVCPRCGWSETKPWSECWHVCKEPAAHPQAFDPSEDSQMTWTQMVKIHRGYMRLVAQHMGRPEDQFLGGVNECSNSQRYQPLA